MKDKSAKVAKLMMLMIIRRKRRRRAGYPPFQPHRTQLTLMNSLALHPISLAT